MIRILCWLRREPMPTDEALRERAELQTMAAKVREVVTERERLHAENNFTARVRALYLGGH